MKRTFPPIFLILLIVLPLVLSSCIFKGHGEKPETAEAEPVETEPPIPLFSWEEPGAGNADSQGSSKTGGPAELRDFGSMPPASTKWTSLTEGEDTPRDGLFTRAAAALVTEQLVRYCMRESWLSPGFTVPDQQAVTAFLVSTYRYRNVNGYPTYLASLLEWDADAQVYAVSSEAADAVARGFFGYTESPTETKTGFGYDFLSGRYEFGSGTIERTSFEISDLKVSSDAISTEARFRVTEIAGGRRTDRGEYRIFYYQPNGGTGSPLPKMLFLKKGAALTAAQTQTEPPLTGNAATGPVPSFLSPEVQILYRRAKALYPALVGGPAEAIDLLPLNDNEPYLPGTYYGLVNQTGADGILRTYFYPRGRYTNFYAFNTVLTSIYTWSFAQELTGTRYISIDGRLAADANNPGRSARTDYLPALDDFELIEAADWKIDFWYYSYYGDPESPTVERSLISLLNTDIGWRFASFTTGEYAAGEAIERDVPVREPAAEVPAEQPAETPVPETPPQTQPEQPAEQPTEQPAETPTEQPTEQPAEQPTEQPAEQPAETPATDPNDWWDPPPPDDLPFDVTP
ncbi:MAG: hypothetical protein II889_07280 [Clostridia bacterium]|nr:hypothetical protein [Clostridia bacterium]